MYYQGLPSLIVPSKMMICGTMTLPYLFRIHLFGVGAKVEDSIISGLVTRQGINNVYVAGDKSVTKTYPVAFTKFQLPMCVNHTGNYSGWAYCTNKGDLTSVNIYATHEWMNLAVVAIGV